MAAAIGAVAQLVGKFAMSKDKQRNERRQRRTFIQDRVKDAQMAGISPLAAIGAAGYSGSSAPSGTGEYIGAFGKMIQEVSIAEKRAQIDKLRAEKQSIDLSNAKQRNQLNANDIAGIPDREAMNRISFEAMMRKRPGYVRNMFIPVRNNANDTLPAGATSYLLQEEIAEGMEGAVPGAISGAGFGYAYGKKKFDRYVKPQYKAGKRLFNYNFKSHNRGTPLKNLRRR